MKSSVLAKTALVLGAVAAIVIPATAFAQTVSCSVCTHEVSYFKGSGGLIAKVDGATEVTWVAQCGSATRSGTLTPNADGVVSLLFNDDNSRACNGDDGRFRLGPIDNGGWYWITDAENSAVANLVNLNILGNVQTTLADAGSGIATAKGRGATFVKETATGRIGVLPNILPVPPIPPIRKCGFTGTPEIANTGNTGPGANFLPPQAAPVPKRRVNKSCKLGNGKALIRFYSDVGRGGSQAQVPNDTIVRPYFSEVTVFPALYMNGTGHYTVAANGDPDLGWEDGTPLGGAIDNATSFNPYVKAFLVGIPGVGGGHFHVQNANANAYGARLSGSHGIAIGGQGAASRYCGTREAPKNNTMEIVTVMRLNSTRRLETNPPVPNNVPLPAGAPSTVTGTYAASATLRVICPSSPEAQALRKRGLVPESVFATEATAE